MVDKLERSAHVLPGRLRPAAPFRRARPDKVALRVRQPAKDGDHQPPSAGGGVRPRLRQRAELPARVHDLLDDGAQVERGSRSIRVNVTTSPEVKAAIIAISNHHAMYSNLGSKDAFLALKLIIAPPNQPLDRLTRGLILSTQLRDTRR
jgi:hypothetical protein